MNHYLRLPGWSKEISLKEQVNIYPPFLWMFGSRIAKTLGLSSIRHRCLTDIDAVVSAVCYVMRTCDPVKLSARFHPCVTTHVSTKTESGAPHVVVADTVMIYKALHGEGHGGSYCLDGGSRLWVVHLFGALLPIHGYHICIQLKKKIPG